MNKSKFSFDQDKHWFFVGVLSSVSAVIVWDLIKSRLKILNYEVKEAKKNNDEKR
tara:strand:- start:203 stop:367 length:165 start_codon:yes stop_codon:yes gene_type:complete